MDNSVYTKMDYEVLLSGKKHVLAAQINCLNILKTIENYKVLRKKETMLKLKVKNNIKDIKNQLSKISENIPKKAYEEVEENERKINKAKNSILTLKKFGEKESLLKESSKEFSIEQELLEIQRKLAHLS
ncbi:MAG TPA: hypothetical protein VI815_01900 [Candidatus Nanoarchaeia archaeon]|nr:hypothetical protein [Candidatus Nanoarchaeia archaeon]